LITLLLSGFVIILVVMSFYDGTLADIYATSSNSTDNIKTFEGGSLPKKYLPWIFGAVAIVILVGWLGRKRRH
jgi:hypothetical protein